MDINKLMANLLSILPVWLLPTKRGQAFTMMMMIGIAILALLVLVIVFLVAGKMGGYGKVALGSIG